MAIDRRHFMTGVLAAAALPATALRAASSSPEPRLYAGTPLAKNPLARSFAAVDLVLPSIKVSDGARKVSLASLTGKIRIVTLWAEWCAPCLVEARDFAELRKRFANADFDIVAVLTGSIAKLDHADAVARLQKAGAGDLPVLVEEGGGNQIMRRLALDPAVPQAKFGTLPCTLLVDREGRIRGRAHGAPMQAGVQGIDRPSLAGAERVPRVLTQAEKAALLDGKVHSAWASPAGDAFVMALRDGLPR